MDLDGFARFCGGLMLENGRKMKLEPFQRTMLGEYFDGALETLILIPKKNGKTTLLAALALYHLLNAEDPNIAIAANSRDQAMVLFDQARGFVLRAQRTDSFDELAQLDIRRGYREIRKPDPGNPKEFAGLIKVYAADADKVDGWIGTLALVDELHRAKSGDLYQVFRDGLGPRDGQIITISTAGDDEDSLLGQLRRAAHALPGMKREGYYRHAATEDFALHEWGLDEEDDRSDLEVVAQANPASWQTPKALKRRFDSPSMRPWEWARFACGTWLAGEHSWLDAGMWAACYEAGADIPDLQPVYLGVDVGIKKDSSAIATLWRRKDGKVVVKARVFTPPKDGPLDLSIVEQEIREQANRYTVLGVSYDRWSFERSAQMLGDEGLLMVEFPMTNERTVPATSRLYGAITQQRVVHDGDPLLAAHVNAGSLKGTERGMRLGKNVKHNKPIDALIALLIAFQHVDADDGRGGFEW